MMSTPPRIRTLYARLWIALLACLVSACNLGTVPPSANVGGKPQPVLILAAADATITPTPFQPMAVTPTFIPTDIPTPTPLPTQTPEPIPATPEPEEPQEPDYNEGESRSWADYPGPSVWPDVQIPSPTGLLAQPDDQVNILLLGSDQRPYDGGFRTDTVLLLTLTPSLGKVSLTSFPRDLYVYIPGWTVERINTAFAHGGFQTLALTMEYNFGVRPDHYVLVKMDVFEDIINNLGGIYVNVMTTLTDQRDGYGQYTVYSGNNLMDGGTAMWYVRSRYSTSDFDRGRRQQEVLEGIFRKILSLDGLARAPQLYELYINNVQTDMDFDDMAAFLPLAAQLSNNPNITRNSIGPHDVIPIVNSYGAQVLLPIREPILAIMRDSLNTP